MPLFRRRREPDPDHVLEQVPDDLPRDGIFAQPLVVARLQAQDPEPQADGTIRVGFRATVKDAEGKRCPDLNIQARVTGPEREATGETTTDLMGQARFRMTGPAGRYRIEVLDVAAGGLTFDRDASVLEAVVEV